MIGTQSSCFLWQQKNKTRNKTFSRIKHFNPKNTELKPRKRTQRHEKTRISVSLCL